MKKDQTKPAAFIDRDGVLCNYVDHLHKLEDFKLRPQVPEAISLLNQNQYWVFVVTNQPMVAKGLLTLETLSQIHTKLINDLLPFHARVDAIEFCPHSVDGIIPELSIECDCRKPKVGMLTKLTNSFSIDLKRSVFIGDTWRDVQCGQRFGLKSYGVTGGAGFPYPPESPHAKTQPDVVVDSLLDAVNNLLGLQGKGP